MSSRLFLFLAALLLVRPAGADPAARSAGELQRATTTASAASRNHGDGALRVLVWYPATGPEHAVDIGPPSHQIFITGQVAAAAPFADQDRHPLILLSHGFGGVARQLTWLGAPLARRGYIVVAVDHPGTNGRDGVTAEGAYAPWERAGDLRAALDLVLADPDLAPHINAQRIGVAGFSIGGFTGLLEAGGRPDFDRFIRFCDGPKRDAICDPQLEYPLDIHKQAGVLAEPAMHDIAARRTSDFRDPRVKAAFLIAPAVGQAFDRASLRRIRIPVEIILGEADPVAPPATNGEYLAGLIPNARLKILPGVGHYDFLSECGPAGAKIAAAYCAGAVDRAMTHATTVAEAIAFFDRAIGPWTASPRI
jgi:predicted dienelactone hydrolase